MGIGCLLGKAAETWDGGASARFGVEEADPECLTMNQFWRQASRVARRSARMTPQGNRLAARV